MRLRCIRDTGIRLSQGEKLISAGDVICDPNMIAHLNGHPAFELVSDDEPPIAAFFDDPAADESEKE